MTLSGEGMGRGGLWPPKPNPTIRTMKPNQRQGDRRGPLVGVRPRQRRLERPRKQTCSAGPSAPG
jgi:hypothetical protein